MRRSRRSPGTIPGVEAERSAPPMPVDSVGTRPSDSGGPRPPVERLPVDPKVVGRIAGSPRMRREQGVGFMERWGGPQKYRERARMPRFQRSVYEAVLSGVSDEDQLALSTGLAPEQIEKALEALRKKGLIKVRG